MEFTSEYNYVDDTGLMKIADMVEAEEAKKADKTEEEKDADLVRICEMLEDEKYDKIYIEGLKMIEFEPYSQKHAVFYASKTYFVCPDCTRKEWQHITVDLRRMAYGHMKEVGLTLVKNNRYQQISNCKFCNKFIYFYKDKQFS